MSQNDINVEDSQTQENLAVATDLIGNTHYPIYKISYGPPGSQIPVSDNKPLPVISSINDKALDAFGRLRVSNPVTMFDSKQISDNSPLFWDDQEVSGGGTTSVYSKPKASSTMGVANVTAGKRIRQTYMRFNYKPGKSQLIYMTGTLGDSGGGAGIVRAMGLFDDNNGIFLEDNEGVICVVLRSSTTGVAVDNRITQDNWSEDTMDGNGPSGITLNAAMSQLLVIDYEWLSIGRVRVGVIIDGETIYLHHFNHGNITKGAYMSTPNLPLRYEISNDGTGAASTLEHICSTVISEGESQDLGVDRFHSTEENSINANVVGTVYAVIGIRLKSANLDHVANVISTTLLGVTNDDYHWDLRHNPVIAGAAPAFNDVTNASYQIAVADIVGNPSVNTVTGGHIVAGGYVKAGGNAGSIDAQLKTQLRIGASIAGVRDELWICVNPLASNANVHGGIGVRDLT